MKVRPSSLLRTKISLHPSPYPPPLPSTARPSSTFTNPSQISAYLAQPTWSVRDTLLSSSPSSTSSSKSSSAENEITKEKLHHLLRLSALPLPTSPEAETRLLNDLHRQLRFVQAIQDVDTKGVESLVAIRDETARGMKEREVGMGDVEIARELGSEKRVGRRGRVVSVRMKGKEEGEGVQQELDPPTQTGQHEDEGPNFRPILPDHVDDGQGGKWDPVARAGRRSGRYIVVDTAWD